jgi:hypothetical protein
MRSLCTGKVWVGLGLFGLSLMRLERKYRRLWNVSYFRTSCIIIKCRSFRVLTKALFTHSLVTGTDRNTNFYQNNLLLNKRTRLCTPNTQ